MEKISFFNELHQILILFKKKQRLPTTKKVNRKRKLKALILHYFVTQNFYSFYIFIFRGFEIGC